MKSTYEKMYDAMRNPYIKAVKENLQARREHELTNADVQRQSAITGYSACVMNALTAAMGSTTLASRVLEEWNKEAKRQLDEEA